MAESKCLYHLLAVCCLIAVVAGTNIRFPRKNVMSLTDLKNAGNTWYEMAYAAALPETNLYITIVKLNSSGLLLTSYRCSLNVKGNSEYYAFVSSDPSQYLLVFWCWDNSGLPESRTCLADNTDVFLFVKNNRPDSFPLMSAINDLKRNTDGVLDFDNEIATSGDDPLKFFYTMTDQYSCG